jgi:DNA modification methylase
VDEYGAYADQEDVYWKLLEGMAKHKKRLIYPSAHMIFWFSMKFHGQTVAFFQKHFPEFTIEECPLIWWKDRSIAPDVQRRPRRAYETALFMFSGNRPIVNTRSNLVQAPCGNKIHASEKPARMLRAFFQMVVDKHTRMLDPTCGSGTSVRAAKSLGANVAVGIEKHTPFYDSAVRAYQIAQALNFKDIQEVEDAVE